MRSRSTWILSPTGTDAVVAGIMQHIEEAGIHSGDSAAVLPPYRIWRAHLDEMRNIARRVGAAPWCCRPDERPVRHSRWQALRAGSQSAGLSDGALHRQGRRYSAGSDCSAGDGGEELWPSWASLSEPPVPGVFVKAPVFPFRRFPGVDPLLGPEMKSTGEVMGASADFGRAFAKAWLGAGHLLPTSGIAFLSVNDRDKKAVQPVARRLLSSASTRRDGGTASSLGAEGILVERVHKVHEGRPHVVDLMVDRRIDLVVNTPLGRASHEDDALIRQTALKFDIPCITTLSGAMAAAEGMPL